ncbi:hypothetical protein D0Z00_001094 [Geotrichum galactomycetum]|uniref:Uncharacterized protein n=1 Tax=Geotrichum galactomycetum TaxID=27317 RepID=A0ACB6V811_9ASCO|nr:hypothetical protein D0Z00_001094 [Geotrichum candidum]
MVSSKTFIATAALATAVAAVPFPEAIAQLPGATMQCHEACGNLILESRKCSDNECLCSSDSPFMSLAPECLDCGWQLWTYYGKYLSEPLGKCNLPTEPTGVNPTAQPATTAAETPATSSEPETTKAPEQPAQTEPAQTQQPVTQQPETSKTEEPAAPASSAPAAPASSAPAAPASSAPDAPASSAPVTSAPAAPATSTPVQASSSSEAAPVVTSAKPTTSVKFANTTIVTETICTKSACQNPKPTQTIIEQVNGATQYTVAGALAFVAGVAALF